MLAWATADLAKGTRNELTFDIAPRGKCQRISHCRRLFEARTPVNGKVIDNDLHHAIVVDTGLPIVVSLLAGKPSEVRRIKINSWVTFWPSPPTHGIILGKA